MMGSITCERSSRWGSMHVSMWGYLWNKIRGLCMCVYIMERESCHLCLQKKFKERVMSVVVEIIDIYFRMWLSMVYFSFLS